MDTETERIDRISYYTGELSKDLKTTKKYIAENNRELNEKLRLLYALPSIERYLKSIAWLLLAILLTLLFK